MQGYRIRAILYSYMLVLMCLPANLWPTDLGKSPPKSASATKEELLEYLKIMYTMRRMEITCDTEYKVRQLGCG